MQPEPAVAGYRASWIAEHYPELITLWLDDPLAAEELIDENETHINFLRKFHDNLPWHDWTEKQWEDSFSPKKEYTGTDTAEQIKSRIDSSKIVSRYTKLTKRSDTSLIGLCPFHTEKTPSFNFNRVKNLFHCFGCGKSGDIITLVMEKEKCDFRSALKLCDKWG